MVLRLLHLLILFFYLNSTVYEPGSASSSSLSLSGGNSLIEFFLSDLLEIPGSTDVKELDMVNENYQPVNIIICIFPAVIFFLSFFLFRKTGKVVLSIHPFYRTKSFCLQTCYSYLFRLKPF